MNIQFYNKNGLGCPGDLLTWKLMQGGDYTSFVHFGMGQGARYKDTTASD